MYKRKSIKKLGKTSTHRKAMILNQLRSLIQSGKVKTSSVKAKVLKGEIESVFNTIKSGKRDDLSLTRELSNIFGKSELAKKAIEVAKKATTKVTIKKVGFRSGDNTEMSLVEISGFKTKKKVSKKGEEVKEEEVVETKQSEEVKKGILNLGRKQVSKKIEPMKKERTRTRSGL